MAAAHVLCSPRTSEDTDSALIEAALEISRQEIELKAKMREAIEQNDLGRVLEIAKMMTGLM